MKKLFFISVLLSLLFSGKSQPGNTWQITGPVQFPLNVSGQINGIGRVTSIKFDPINQTRVYVTSASGGLWRSNDTGYTWTNVNTDYMPNMECASICIDHTNNNILYLGSGDPNYYYSSYGVWKSTNGGTTWAQSNTGMGTPLIVELIMQPTNNQVILAATDNGIYRTTNAGGNWTQVKSGGDFKAMVLKPNSKDTVYAVTSSQVWRTTNFGATWQQITAGVNIPGANGQGMRIAVSKASPNIVYVSMITNEGLTLKSTDYGTTFGTVYNNPSQSLVGYDATTPGQGDYNFGMTADPNNANTVYIAAHCVWKSTNGGVAWTKLTDWAIDCHTDMHGIVVHPTFTNMIFNVNDGGVFVSRDGGDNWDPRSDGVAATENYQAAQSNFVRNQVSIGTQDNGELYSNNNGWFTNRGGDWGSPMLYDYNSSNKVYYFENGNRRTVNGGETSFNPPFAATSSSRMAFNRKIPGTGFLALQKIYISNNINTGSPSWTQIANPTGTIAAIHSSHADSSVLYAITKSNLIYRCDNVFAASPTFTSYTTPAGTGLVASIATVKTNSNVVVVSCGSLVYRSTNKGQSFTTYSTGIPAGVNVIKIYHDEFSTDESLYACTSKAVYYRNNTMSSWQNITYNLPSIADITDFMFYNDGTAASCLRVAYYGRGVWELPVNTSMPPSVSFISDKQIVCAGASVTFTNFSYSNVTSRQWSFPGGTPATSTLNTPVIVYNTAGVFPVSYTATNANGSGTTTQTAYIKVISPQALPVIETFSTASFPPQDWTLFDDGNNSVNWDKSTTTGGFGLSSESTFFDNFNFAVGGKRDGLVTGTYNFTGVLNPKLYFDVAYCRYSSVDFDSLAVRVTTNCGQSYTTVYLNGNTGLATAPDNSGFFTPASNEWRTDTVYLTAFANQPQVQFEFQNRGNYGNVLYLDNINVLAAPIMTSVKNEAPATIGLMVYPNPTSGVLNIKLEGSADERVVFICDNLGREMYKASSKSNQLQLDTSAWPRGVYFVTVTSKAGREVKKVIVQ